MSRKARMNQRNNKRPTIELKPMPAHGRDLARNPYAPLARRPVRRDQEYRLSILDSILTLLHLKPETVPPDEFEEYLREQREVTIADLYHVSRPKPASHLQGCFRMLQIEASNDTAFSIADLSVDNATITDYFAHIRRTSVGKLSHCSLVACITHNDTYLGKLFSPGRLFTLSAYDKPHFWSRMLLAYLLHWCEHADAIVVDELAKAPLSQAAVQRPQLFRLPSCQEPTSPYLNFIYSWPSSLPSFSALRSHTTRPYRMPVAADAIQLFSKTLSDGSLRATLYFSSPACLQRFQFHLKRVFPEAAITIASSQRSDEYIIPGLILAIQDQMNTESLDRAEKTIEAAHQVTLRSRDHPGRTEFLYLTYLQDYISFAIDKVKKSRDRLEHLHLGSAPDHFDSVKKAYLADASYVLDALAQADLALEENKQQVKALEELKQTQIAGIMSFLVAIYVPLAFVSSYFGMNTTNFLEGSVDNSTFWKVAIPLAVGTIMLPLSLTIVGRIARGFSLSTAAFSYKQFPMMIDMSIIAYIIGVVVAHVIHWRTSQDKRFVVFFHRVSPQEPTIANSILLLLCLLKTFEQSVLKNRRGRLWFFTWTLITTVTILCDALSVVDETSATLITPIVFFFFVIACRPLLF